MRKLSGLMAVLLFQSGCTDAATPQQAKAETGPAEAAAAPQSAPSPDLATCDANHEANADALPPEAPVEIGAPFRTIAVASPLEMAILTKSGATLCTDFSWIYQIDAMEWLAGDRLLGWNWSGDEAFGYHFVDRQGQGKLIETGAMPFFSPSTSRFASIQLSDSGWGRMEGFGVWEVTEAGTRELSRQAASGPDYMRPAIFETYDGDWRIAQWQGESCVDIHFLPNDSDGNPQPSAAVPYHARQSNDWQVVTGACR